MGKSVYPVILGGGSGTRLWPASREGRAKQFLSVTDNDRTLLQETCERAKCIGRVDHVHVVTVSDFCDKVREQLPELPEENILVEPATRNTMAAIGFATQMIYGKDPDAIIVILPADHVIQFPLDFIRAVESAVSLIRKRQESIALIGIETTSPSTQYGYIKIGRGLHDASVPTFEVNHFIEKPCLSKAEEYHEDWQYYWNGGYFVFFADTMRACIEEYAPRLHAVLKRVSCSNPIKLDAARDFEQLDKIPVDKGIIEKLDFMHLFCVTARCGWADVGSWTTMWKSFADDESNLRRGKVMSDHCHGCVLWNDSEVDVQIVAIALSNIAVVVSGGIVAIFDREKSADIKEVLEKLRMCEVDGTSAVESYGWVIENYSDFHVALYGVEDVRVVIRDNVVLIS